MIKQAMKQDLMEIGSKSRFSKQLRFLMLLESKVDKPAGKDWFGTIYKGRHDFV